MADDAGSDTKFDAMTEACIDAGERVMQTGSPPLRAAMRLALFILGQEIARRNPASPFRSRAEDDTDAD